MYGFFDDRTHDLHVAVVQFELLPRWSDTNDLRRARRQLVEHTLTGPAQENRLQQFAQLAEVLVAQNLAVFVDDTVAVVESKRRCQSALVDELDNGVEFIDAVLERCAGEDQSEG